MIRALFFDYGGVIADDSAGERLSDKLAANLSIGRDRAWAMLSPLWHQLTRGKITESGVWTSIEAQYGKPITEPQRRIWNIWDTMPRFQDMLAFVAQLKQEGYQTGIISTIIPATADEISAHGGYDLFNPIILSFEVGYAKPDPEIYQIALKRLDGLLPEEVIYLDDREVCLGPARALGMRTVLVETPQQAIADVRRLLDD
jgi:putative hydrolase of the HAD superfamily